MPSFGGGLGAPQGGGNLVGQSDAGMGSSSNVGQSQSQSQTQIVPGMLDVYNQLLGLNSQNYGNILGAYGQGQSNLTATLPSIYQGYGDIKNEVMGTLGVGAGAPGGEGHWGVAAPAAQAIAQSYATQRGNTDQQLINSGLGNSTIRAGAQNANALGAAQAYGGLGAQLAQTAAGYQAQLGLAGQAAQMQGLGMQTGLTQAYLGDLAGYGGFANKAGSLTGQFSTGTSQQQGSSSQRGGSGGGNGAGRGQSGGAPAGHIPFGGAADNQGQSGRINQVGQPTGLGASGGTGGMQFGGAPGQSLTYGGALQAPRPGGAVQWGGNAPAGNPYGGTTGSGGGMGTTPSATNPYGLQSGWGQGGGNPTGLSGSAGGVAGANTAGFAPGYFGQGQGGEQTTFVDENGTTWDASGTSMWPDGSVYDSSGNYLGTLGDNSLTGQAGGLQGGFWQDPNQYVGEEVISQGGYGDSQDYANDYSDLFGYGDTSTTDTSGYGWDYGGDYTDYSDIFE
jgi:hypothetical protein